MDGKLVLLFAASSAGGLFVASRVLRWVATLVHVFGHNGGASQRSGAAVSLVPVFMHSGPWSLGLAIAGTVLVAQAHDPGYLWAVILGLSSAVVVVGIGALALRRRKAAARVTIPLTPERLARLRRRFFLQNASIFAIGAVVTASFTMHFDRSRMTVVVSILAGIVGYGTGWVWSWFMWQFYSAALERVAQLRQKRERAHAA